MGEALNSGQKSIIDRYVRLLYQEIREECMRNRGRKEGEKEVSRWNYLSAVHLISLPMPKSYVSYRKLRKLSDEQREQARLRMEKINLSGKEDGMFPQFCFTIQGFKSIIVP